MLVMNTFPASAQVNYSFIANSLYDSEELLPSPTLDGQLIFHEVDNSDEFSYSLDVDSQGSTIAILNWSHTAGVLLDYNTTPTLPVCQEYIYLGQNISWNHDIVPTALNISITYQVNASGNFLGDNWPGMFEIQTWFMRPDGFQTITNRFYWGHRGFQTQYTLVDLSSIDTIFSPLCESIESQAFFAIALVPSWRFLDNFGESPWQFFNGSVVAQFKEIHLDTLYRESNSSLPVKQAFHSNTWRMGQSDRYHDSELGPDGNLYILTYQEMNGVPWGTTLTRINEDAEIVWQKSWNGTQAIFWRDLCISDSEVLMITDITTPTGTDILLASFSFDGQSIDTRTYDFLDYDYAGCIDIGPDNSIYLGLYTSTQLRRNYVVKIDNSIGIMWIEDFGRYQFDTVTSLEVDNRGNVFTRTDNVISKMDTNGSLLWELDGFNTEIFVLADGSALLTSTAGGITNITEIDKDGTRVWSFKQEMRYTPTWREWFYVVDFFEHSNGLIYALYVTYGFHTSSIVGVLNRQGMQIENYTVAFADDVYSAIGVSRFRGIHISNENIIYLVGRVMDEDWNYDFTVSVFGGESMILGVPITTLVSTISAVATISVAIAYLQYRKREN